MNSKSYSKPTDKDRTRYLNEYIHPESMLIFGLFDIKNQGKLELNALKYALRSLGFSFSRADLDSIINKFREVQKTSISYNDFSSIFVPKLDKKNSKKAFSKLFKLIVGENMNEITLDTLRGIIQETTYNFTDDEIQEIMKIIDKDKDGVINFDEYYRIMTKKNKFLIVL